MNLASQVSQHYFEIPLNEQSRLNKGGIKLFHLDYISTEAINYFLL